MIIARKMTSSTTFCQVVELIILRTIIIGVRKIMIPFKKMMVTFKNPTRLYLQKTF